VDLSSSLDSVDDSSRSAGFTREWDVFLSDVHLTGKYLSLGVSLLPDDG